MTQAIRERNGIGRRFAVALLACALFLRLLVPQGWMPVARADGGWQITICTGMGPMKMAAAASGKRSHHGQDEGRPDHPCAFAGFAAALDLPPLPLVELPEPLRALWLPNLTLAAAIGRGLAAPPPPATGPPNA
ncbi:MAG: hypothetical protein JOY99_11970 [Sphingomonadaceae bacterium]|nr:hypothetical protein [Sphingomonadaceae bacterium]